MQYWVFGASPERYRIMDAIRGREVDAWTVGDERPAVGDGVIIWKLSEGDARGGIVAFGQVLSPPFPRADVGNRYWIDPADIATVRNRVDLRYILMPGLPLWLDEHPDPLESLAAVCTASQTAVRVSPEQWNTAVTAAGGWPADAPEVEEAVEAIAELAGRRWGQGFVPSADNRQAVERYAMERAIHHFRALGWTVEEVASRESYDLCCRRAGQPELHAQVKGTTGDGADVLLTPNELAHAREQYPHVALVVVSGIRLTDGATGSHAGLRSIQPWQIDGDALTPLGFRYTLSAPR